VPEKIGRVLRRFSWVAGFAAALAACGQPPPAAPVIADLAGLWRVTLALPGGDLPFGLELARSADGKLTATLLNGSERSKLTDIRQQDAQLELGMPGYQNRLIATIQGDLLSGEVAMVRKEGELQHIPLRARRNQSHRFFASPMQGGAQAGGRWAVKFTESDGKTYAAVGEFQQQGSNVSGTFLTGTGDHRYLSGEVRGQDLYLATFDGGHAFLYRAQFKKPDRIEGTFWSGLHSVETFVAERNDAASLGDAENVTRVRHAATRLKFRFPDVDGKMVSLSDARFKGKAVIVTLAGSWCPNCHDEAAYLAPLYRQWRERGVEIVTLMFERFGDFAQAATATRTFRQQFGIDYPTLIAGVSDKDDAASKLPELNGVFAFPTTLFIGRDGTVRSIHTGFSGPATGAHYQALQRDFAARVEALLSEPVR
jgi:peroxiredoxin